MRGRKIGLSALVGAACLIGQYMAVPMVANAAGTAALPFSQVKFSGYGAGTEVALGAVTINNSSVLAVGQGLSSAATNSAGLTSGALTENGNVVNPVEPASVKAYGSGQGLGLGVGATAAQEAPLLAGKAASIAPPVSSEVTKQVGPINLAPIATASALTGRSDAVYDSAGAVCPLGGPISYGYGNAANVQLASLNPGNAPIANTSGGTSGTQTANSTSYTYLNSNGDGSYGLASQTTQIVAPVTANLLNLVKLQLTVGGGGTTAPVTLNATTSGESSKAATVTLANNTAIDLKLSIGGGAYMEVPGFPVNPSQLSSGPGANGLNINLDSAQLGSAIGGALSSLTGTQLLSGLSGVIGSGSAVNQLLTSLLNTLGGAAAGLADVNLGSIDIEARPHAIGGSVTSEPVASADGTQASGAVDLVKLNLGLSGTLAGTALPNTLSNLVNLAAGHLEAAAALNTAINCPIPVIKTSTPSTVTAGNDFVYTIAVPDPAKLDLLSCSLDDLSVVDAISDVPPGKSTFQVVSASEQGATGGKTAGKITQPSPTNATVAWSGLTYNVAPVGQTPTTPDIFTITVAVPKDSPTGTLQDTANAAATAADCNGGATGISNLGGVNGNQLTGTFHLVNPKVTAAPAAALASQAAAGSATPGSLPKTGGEGGLWQPGLGLGILLLGGGAFGLVRRSRRQSR